jgi:hypothetical protein
MDNIINSKIPSASVFILSAIVSMYVSNSTMWICLNCILPAVMHVITTMDELAAEDSVHSTGIRAYNISAKLDYFVFNLMSMCYSFTWYSWYMIPICILYNSACESANSIGTCTSLSIGIAVLRKASKVWIAFPLAYIGCTKYEDRKKFNILPHEYKRLTWELYTIIATLLILASYNM